MFIFTENYNGFIFQKINLPLMKMLTYHMCFNLFAATR